MSELWQVSGYVALAHRAAVALGAPSDAVVRAILAQWTCEQPAGGPWPPPHDNPGNLTRAIGTEGGPIVTVATTPPGAGLLYVYPTPEAGADAYARYLLASPRYIGAVAAARGGNGYAFLADVCAAGYGTLASCALGVFGRVTLPPPPVAFHRWLCIVTAMNVRSAPHVGAPIVGGVRQGATIAGPIVAGGLYTIDGRPGSAWIELSASHYTAAGGYRQLA